MTTSFTPFSDRLAPYLDPADGQFRTLNVSHPLVADFAEADDTIQSKIEELRNAAGDRFTVESLYQLGARFARGELKASTVVARANTAETIPNAHGICRLDSLEVGVVEALTADLDKPEWSDAAIRKMFVGIMQDLFDRAAVEMVVAWNECSDKVKALAAGPGVRFDTLDSDLPTLELSVDEIAQARRVRTAWSKWYSGDDDGIDPWYGWGLGAVATILRDGVRPGAFYRDTNLERFNSDLLWLPTDCVKWYAAGVHVKDLFVGGFCDRLAPLVDPAGKDSGEYRKRCEIYEDIRNFRNEYEISLAAGVPLHKRGLVGQDFEAYVDRVHNRPKLSPAELIAEYEGEE